MVKNRIRAWLRPFSRFAKKRRTVTRRATPLQLEWLEDRYVPSVSANDAYVASLYQGLLGRNADPGGLANWSGWLNAGANRAQVALGIEQTDEFAGRAVQIFYDGFLGRPAGLADVNFWVQAVRQGATLTQVKAGILGSDEFFFKSGNTMAAYLNAVYEHELGRGLDQAGAAYWSMATPNNPTGRSDSALAIMRSLEGREVELSSIYEDVLGRWPDAAGASYWLGLFQKGEDDTKIIARIVGTDEYFAPVQAFAGLASDPNEAAHEFIVNMHRFDATLPGAEQLNGTIPTNPALVLPPPVPPPFFPITALETTGPFFTTGPFLTPGFGPTFGPTGGFTGGCCSSGGFSGGGFSGGGFSGGSSGGGSGSLRAAIPQEGAGNGGMQGVGGSGQGGGLYLGGGLLTLPNATPSTGTGQLTNPQLQAAVAAALVRLEQAGVSPALLARIESFTFEVGPLPASLLGYTFGRFHTVVINENAAGSSWFVDPTPLSNEEFAQLGNGALVATPGGPADGRMDLETAVLHEMGHVAGYPDVSNQAQPNALMALSLPAGQRRVDAIDAIFSGALARGP